MGVYPTYPPCKAPVFVSILPSLRWEAWVVGSVGGAGLQDARPENWDRTLRHLGVGAERLVTCPYREAGFISQQR